MGPCYQSLEALGTLANELLSLMEIAYLPQSWADGLLALKDLVDLQAAIYGYCRLEKLYFNAAQMLT